MGRLERLLWVEPRGSVAVLGMAGIGASTSLLVAAATVGSLNRQQPLAGSPGRYHTDRRQGLRPGEPPEGKLDRSKGDKGGEVLEILG